MNQSICIYCNSEFIGKRKDAKYCTSTCKAKYWEEQKANEKATLPVKLADGLRGIVDTNPAKIKEKSVPEFYTKEIQVETAAYKFGKVQLSQIQTSIRRLENQKTKMIAQAKLIASRNGDIYYVAGATAGVCIADKDLKDKKKVLIGAGLGLLAGFVADKLFKNGREKDKQTEINEITKNIKEIDVYLTSVKQSGNKISDALKAIPQFEKKTVLCPLTFSIDSLFPSKPETQTKLQETKRAEPTKIDKTKKAPMTLPSPVKSDKVISSQELHNMDYTALDFQGKWNILFGYPSVNFHCVLTGMSGEGKSTFAIQFANYLAENFGRVLYISGEEGFSKTFKDKFITNNAIAEDLYVADIRSYDSIINEIAPDTYHFIFIDSLDNMRIDAEKMKLLRELYKESALITISQSTKDGKMRGSYEIVHDCDIGVKVENGIATTTKNRFKEKGMEMRVFG